MDHSEETAGQLVVAGGDGAVDLQVTEHSFDAIALLVERAVMFDLYALSPLTHALVTRMPFGEPSRRTPKTRRQKNCLTIIRRPVIY